MHYQQPTQTPRIALAACAALLGATALACEPVLVKPGVPPDVAREERVACATWSTHIADVKIRDMQAVTQPHSGDDRQVNWFLTYQMYRLRLFDACLRERGWVER
jgi:hypothetical protein